MVTGKTIFSKVWDSHLLAERPDGQSLIYVDRHLTHEVTSPLAFEALRKAGRRVRRPDLTFAVMDHNVPTGDRSLPVRDEMSSKQMKALTGNATQFGLTLFDYFSPYQGISHVIGPELGLTIPGITLTCGDSHTSTHGALGALALGIGSSEGEHVFATQSIWIKKPREMAITLRGRLRKGVTSKDVILSVIRRIGTGGAIGNVVEFVGEATSNFSVEERLTITNMAIEGGARTAIISPDEKVYEYIRGSKFAPTGADWGDALEQWRSLPTDPGAVYDSRIDFNISELEPQVSWGTNPAMTVGVTESIPSPSEAPTKEDALSIERALKYMGLAPGTRITDIPLDTVFIGSCTNARLSDLTESARVIKGNHVNKDVRALVVPGSQLVKRRAEALGLDKIFVEAGFEWRNSGCSMCIGMNEDKLSPGERCASTSNRNFENRQGPGGRTHLVSPIMAAAAALHGRFIDTREVELIDPEELAPGGLNA